MKPIFVFVVCSLILSTGMLGITFAQTQEGSKTETRNIGIQNVQCKEQRILVINNAGNAALCIKESSVERFIKLGWSTVSPPASSDISVKILNTFERPTSPGTFTVIFRVCADSEILRTPQVIVSSDAEIRIFNMIKNIDSYSCYNSGTLIKSSNSESISIKVNNQGDSNQKILDLEQKISRLKAELEKQNLLLSKLINESSTSDKINPQIDHITDDIQRLRMELADTRAEYYNLLYSRYAK